MARSFFDVQRQQRMRSAVMLAFLAFVYFAAISLPFLVVRWFLMAFTGAMDSEGDPVGFWSWSPPAMAVVFACGLLVPQIWYARLHAVGRLLAALKAEDPDAEDRYHQRFRNLVEEMAIAAGRAGRVRAVVAPSMTLTAFAAEDKSAGAVIGVTEGLLGRLSRNQIQAVVAQEMAHIKEGDALVTTINCAMLAPFQNLAEFLEGVDRRAGDEDMEIWLDVGRTHLRNAGRFAKQLFATRSRTSERNSAESIAGPVVLTARLASAMVSREREVLADAGAAQYTRNPLALAEALHEIAHHHHFMGGLAAGYAPLFIVDPMTDSLDAAEGGFQALFASHPSVKKRVARLMRMAHADPESLEWQRKPDYETERLPDPGSKPEAATEEWFLRQGDQWAGPMTTAELLAQATFGAEAWIMQRHVFTPVLARQHPELRRVLEEKAAVDSGRLKAVEAQKPDPESVRRANAVSGLCPHCVAPLEFREYEGATVRHCTDCGGHWVRDDQVKRVLARRERQFSDSFRMRALDWYRQNWARRETDIATDADDPMGGLFCPDCGQPLVRRFYSYQYFVVVDRCLVCEAIWFDRDELETLQVLQETKPAPPSD